VPSTIAAALVALAMTGGTPIARSAENEKIVPPPATAFSAPARKPAADKTMISNPPWRPPSEISETAADQDRTKVIA